MNEKPPHFNNLQSVRFNPRNTLQPVTEIRIYAPPFVDKRPEMSKNQMLENHQTRVFENQDKGLLIPDEKPKRRKSISQEKNFKPITPQVRTSHRPSFSDMKSMIQNSP